MKHFKNLVLVATSIVLIGVACTKDTTPTTSLVGNWVKRSAFDGNGRAGAACFVINNIAYVGTGYDGTTRYDDLWAFDAAANNGKGAWSQKAYMTGSIKRNSAAAFAIGTNGYIVGGACDANISGAPAYNGKLNDTWKYDATLNTWSSGSIASLPDPNATVGSGARYGAVGFAINGKGYVSCGYTGSHTKDMYEFDGTGWTTKTSMPSTDKRTGAAVMVYGNKAYIVSGTNNGVAVNEMWVFDPTGAGSWEQKRNITNTSSEDFDDSYSSIVRSNAVAFVIGDNGYLTTGINGAYTSNTWEYDFVKDTWTERTKFERAERSDAVGFTINGRGFVALGKNSTYYYDNVEEFLPTATYDAND